MDVSNNSRVSMLVDLVKTMSETKEPRLVLNMFIEAMREAFGPWGYVGLSTAKLDAGQFRIVRHVDHTGRNLMEPAADHHGWPFWLPTHQGGFVGEIVVRGEPQFFVDIDVTDDSVFGDTLTGYRSALSLPIYERGEIAMWAILLGDQRDTFSESQFEDLLLRANLIGLSLQKFVISAALKKANERNREEIDRIASIQRALLPAALPKVPGLEFAVSYVTFDRAGGDLYGFYKLPDAVGGNRIGIIIADVSGHGPAATVVMAMMHAFIESYSHNDQDPCRVLTYLNRRLCASRIESCFVTAMAAVYEGSGRMTYACAGHPPMLRCQHHTTGNRIQRLDGVGGPPLGILPRVRYEQEEVRLRQGDVVLLYTDGATESRDPKDRHFGIKGLELALSGAGESAEQTIAAVIAALANHRGDRRHEDDQTLVAMRIVELLDGM